MSIAQVPNPENEPTSEPSRALTAVPDPTQGPTKPAEVGEDEVLEWSIEIVFELLGTYHAFHTLSGEAYVSTNLGGVARTIALRSDAFRELLRGAAYDLHKAVAPRHLIESVADVLAARAASCEETVFTRVGALGDKVYLDLGTPSWNAIEIDRDGYRVVATPPVHFLRPRGMLALPTPEEGGDLYDLAPLLSVDPDDFDLLIIFLLGMLRPVGPYPILELSGDAGSGKTVVSKIVRRFIDPNTVALRADPREPRDIVIAAAHSWLVAIDNLSSMPKALADALCRLTSGVGASYRKNYSDGEEVLFDACRPVLVNGIDDLDDRYDLRDRMLSLRCLPIPDSQRRPEADILAEFDAMHARLLGALCRATAAALANREAVVKAGLGLPRLADLAIHAEASRESLGWEPGKAISLLRDQGANARARIVSNDVVASAVLAFARKRGGFSPWTGTASELHRLLADYNADVPQAAQLSKRLNRVAPALRDAGVIVTRGRIGRAGRREITIMLTPESVVTPADAEPVSTSGEVTPRADSADSTSAGSLVTTGRKREKGEAGGQPSAPSASTRGVE